MRRVALTTAAGLVLVAGILLGLNVGGLRERLLHGSAPMPRIQSLAVLPLENLSRDPGQEYIADGMTDELITDLAKIRALKVISRTSVMHFKGTQKTVPEIAKELNVDAVVEGSAQCLGDRVRITAQLIQATTDHHLWAESYERDLKDVLALEDDLARVIAGKIQITLTPEEQTRLASAHTVNPPAYLSYLKGRYFWNKRDRESVLKGLEYFQQAVQVDPAYALARVGLADSYAVLGTNGWFPPREAFAKGKAAAEQALERDDRIAEAYAPLALIKAQEWDWAGAESDFKTALTLNPGYAIAHQWYALLLCSLGRHEDAVQEARRAAELDPLSPSISLRTGEVLFYARRYGEARQALQRTLDLSPDFPWAECYLGCMDLKEQKFKESIAELQRATALSPQDSWIRASLGYAYGLSGRKGDAQALLDELKKESRERYGSRCDVALVCVGLGRNGEALDWLEEAYKQHESELSWINVDPLFDALRSDRRFRDLVRRMNFPSQGPAPPRTDERRVP
jgi:TolB-like protein/tetratricopeptide (TPR) repeat protein